jgi:glycosyltransferase involved in cell wall biosynthesis
LLAADGVAFNSSFHRDSLLAALPPFLAAAPDHRHADLIPAVAAKSTVVPVGVDLARIGPLRPRSGPATVLWNHRWDPDKDVGAALDVLTALAGAGHRFRLVLAGESFVKQAEAHREAVDALGDRVVRSGYLDEDAYVEALHVADVVLSTAHQEFFGISVVEAMYAGALPILPRRLVYPERVPAGLERRCLYRTRRELLDLLGEVAADPELARAEAAGCREAVEGFDWSRVAPATDRWLESVASG